MTTREAGILIGAATVTGIIAVAFFLILGTKQPIPTIPFYKTCSNDDECTSEGLTCSDCMVCQKALGRCTYGMLKSEKCPCVEKEKYPCEFSPGVPGVRTCAKQDVNHTVWGDCKKIY
jgi:hypothetical protein